MNKKNLYLNKMPKKKSIMRKIGDFQKNVGRTTRPVTNAANKIAAVFVGFFGLVCIGAGIGLGQIPFICIGLFIIMIAFCMSYMTSIWTKQVKKNRTAAQIEGTMFEARMARNVYDILTK